MTNNQNSFNYNININPNILNQNEDLKSIFNSMIRESMYENETKFNTSDSLSIYIRKNRNKINQILKEISQFFDSEYINPELLTQSIDAIFNSLLEKKQIIYFLKLMIPILIKSLNKIMIINNKQNIPIFNKMSLLIGKYINQGGIYIRELVEKNIDILLEKFNKKETKTREENLDNNRLISIKLLSQILKNSPLLAFNKIVGKKCFDRFFKVINCYKDPNENIRGANGILIYYFLQMFTGRDRETKKYYLKTIYEHIYSEFIDNIKKNNNSPEDYSIVKGFLITIENIYSSEHSFFRETSNFSQLIEKLFKCFDSNNIKVKIEFIRFIPKLYKLNKTGFRDNYENQFLTKINNLLINDTPREIKKALFLTIGKLSYHLEEESYKFFITQFFALVNGLISDKKHIDDELIRCLSDLFNNKKSVYITQLQSINLKELLPKLVESFFSEAKIEYLISLMKFYDNNSNENISAVIISLNAVSHVICGEFFNLEHFGKYNKINFINEGLRKTLVEMRANLFQNNSNELNKKKTLSENFKLKIQKPDIIINALTLFSLIPNNLFFKDMFIFFNDKLLPLLEFAPNKIYKKIIDLLQCDFIKIYQDDINLSEYIFHNIIESIFTTSLNEQNVKIQIYSFKVITQKKKLLEFCFKDKNFDMIKIFGYCSTINEIDTQEKIIQTVSEVALNDSDKNFYYVFVKKAIYSITFKFYYLDDLIQKENSSYTLYYISKYFMHFIYPSIPVLIIDIANYLILSSDLKSILIINIFKTLIEMFKSDLIKEVNKNVIFKESCDLIFILSFDIMKTESIYDSKFDIILELIYLIIKNQNIDIFNIKDIKKRIENSSFLTLKQTRRDVKQIKDYFNDEKIIAKLNYILDKINNKTIIEILYRNILNVENENCVLNTLKIFGLCGAIDPSKIDNFFDENNTIKYLLEIENNQRAIDEKAIQIITFNNKLNQYEEIDTSSLSDPINMKVVLLGLEILKMNKQDDLSEKLILSLNSLIKLIGNEDNILVDIIVPTILQIFPKFQIERQKLLLESIQILLYKFEDKMKKYLGDVIPFIIKYIEKDYIEIVSKIISIFDEKYKKEFENYYSIIIQKYLSLINSDYENFFNYDKIFMLLIKNNAIKSYLKILFDDLRLKLFEETNPAYINKLLNIIEQISRNKNCEILYASIINNILNKFQMLFNQIYCETEFKFDQKKTLEYFLKTSKYSEENVLIIKNILKIFNNIKENSKEKLISFLSVIYNVFDSYGLINHPLFKKGFKSLMINKNDYTFMTIDELIDEIFYSGKCKGNCIYGFNSFENNNKKKLDPKKTLLKKLSTKEEKYIDKDELVFKAFDNNYCVFEEDYEEWLKSCIKILLEKSPSPYFSKFSIIADYYLSVASELSSHGFYSFYMNSKYEIKKQLEKYLDVALRSNKATDTVVLSILNLAENMTRKKEDMNFKDFKYYGNKCYNMKAYAKALYYFEKYFIKEKNVDVFEKLINIYYQLGIPEWGYGLINLANKNKKEYSEIKNYENKFIWFMNLGEYRKALNMIENRLVKEKNNEKNNFLNEKRKYCLSELFDWEQIFMEENLEKILLSNEEENENEKENKKIDKYEEVYEVINKEIFSSVACSNLDKWDSLQYHVNKINKKIKENFDPNELGENNGDDPDETEVYSGRNSLDKNNLNHRNDKKLCTEYISYNELILKNVNLFNKIDQGKIFDLNLISSLVNILKGNFDVAKKYKEDAKNIILYKLKPLLKESHSRGYALLINNQQISYLEDIIEYKENHGGDLNYLKDMKQIWDKSFSQISFEPMFCRRLLFLYRFIFPRKEIFSTKIKYGNILRKYHFYEQSKIIFKKIKDGIKKVIDKEKDEKELLSLEEQKIKIKLSYNKCLFKNGEIEKAVKKGQKLINLLKVTDDKKEPNIYQKINDKLKGRIYGDYALYINKKYLYSNQIKANEEKAKPKSFYWTKSYVSHSPRLVHRNIFTKEKLRPHILLKPRIYSQYETKNSKEPLFSYVGKNYDFNMNNVDDYFNSNKFKKDIEKVNEINDYLNLATKYYDKSYKYWYNFSNLNYEIYRNLHLKRVMNKEKGFKMSSKNIQQCKLFEINYATNVIKGVKKCLSLIGDNNKKGYQSCLKLIDIFFNLGGENDEILDSIFEIINEFNSNIFILLLPILISRIGINNNKILEKLIQILVKLCLNFPSESLISILIYKYSNSFKKKSIVNKILELVEKANPKLKHIIDNYDIFIKELNKCSSLLHEKWKKCIEEASKMLMNKKYDDLINEFMPLHKLMNNNPDNLYEIHFNQCFYNSLKTAENYLKKYIKHKNNSYIKFAWEIYQTIYNDMKTKYKELSIISLEYVSSLLTCIPENQIGLPGYYFLNKLNKERKQLIIGKIKENNFLDNEEHIVYVKRIDKYLYVFNSKQKPRKISLIGTDDKEYKYLLKSNEDLRQDERIIQVFNFVNSMISLDKEVSSKKLLIPIYPVIPLSNNTGLIGFLPNCETISNLISESRKEVDIPINIEISHLFFNYPKYLSGTLMSKVEAFKETNKLTDKYELAGIIWTKSLNCETWLLRRTNYAQSLAVMSVVGYILGLGDRHPNNLMMDRQNGKIIHIDYGDCFEIAMNRKKFPEKVPFRLTRKFKNALGVSGVEGAFKIVAEKIMKLMRDNKDSLYTILNSMVYDPLVTFKFMLPFMKNITQKEKDIKDININNNVNNNIHSEANTYIHSSSVIDKYTLDSLAKNLNLIKKEKSFHQNNIIIGGKLDNDDDEINKEKEVKMMISKEERKLLYYYEENDEIEFEDLNKAAQNVLKRINEKLNGTDFNNTIPLDVPEQINKLIKQAVDDENLCQLFFGWSPFW